jgi:hypothetical protein
MVFLFQFCSFLLYELQNSGIQRYKNLAPFQKTQNEVVVRASGKAEIPLPQHRIITAFKGVLL